MTDKQYDIAVRACKGLTIDDMVKLRLHLTASIAMGPSSADRVVTSLSHDDEIIMGLAAYMRDVGMPLVSVQQMMQSAQYRTFRKKSPTIEEYLKRVGDKTAQRALLRAGLKAMHEYFKLKRWAISYLTFMNAIDKMPACINREFPGYMQSGLIPMIIRTENGNVRPKQSKRRVQRKRNPSTVE